jgi:hypothetical protein
MPDALRVSARAKELLEATVIRSLGRFGVRIRRFESDVVDLRHQTSDPVEANYYTGATGYLSGTRHALINAPLRDCLILHTNAFRCAPGVGNPFVETLLRYKDGQSAACARAPLKSFFASWQPRNAADVLGIQSSHSHESLRDQDPFAYVLPWDAGEIPDILEGRRTVIRRDHEGERRNGRKMDLGSGWKCWGPVSDDLEEHEFTRLARVFESIRQNGFHRSAAPDGDIGAIVLRANGENRYLISPGHHRAAALAALGHTVAPVRLASHIVRREDVKAWPAVRKGLFSEQIALRIFDRMHSGVQPWMSGRTGNELHPDIHFDRPLARTPELHRAATRNPPKT